MAEELFELHIDKVGTDIDAYAVANKLSSVLRVEVHQLEKKLVKVKLLHGRSEVIKSGLTKDQAERLQVLLKNIGLLTTVKAEWALVPFEKTVAKDEFKCPACGQQQETEEGKIRICNACGIVKDKYELAQKRKQLEKENLRQQKLINQSLGEKNFTSIEQRNEAFLKKRRDKLRPKTKADASSLFILLLAFSAISAGGYMYSASNSGKNDIAEVTENENTHITKQSDQSQQVSAPVAAVGTNTTAAEGGDSVQQSVVQTTNGNDGALDELGNPYSKLVKGSSLPPIAMEDAPKYVDKLLKKNKKHLPPVDKTALKNISTLYKEQDATQDEKPDFQEIKKIASSVSDKGVRSKLIKQASWQEVDSGVKTFDDFSIESMVRKGEKTNAVASAYEAISMYLKDYRYKAAAKIASQIQNNYLQAVALNKVMDNQFYFDLKGAKQQRDKIRLLSERYGLTAMQKPLMLGILYQADRRLGDTVAAEITFKKLLLAVDDMMDKKEKIATLIQLAEDQREGLNFTGAEYFLDAAHQQLGKTRLSIADVDHFYGLLAQSYANIFEFGQANTLLTHIKNTQEKNRIAQVVTVIEKKAAL
ncbi:MAG TPA: hypothetical protein ENJ33_07315 [Thiothrix sp.]|nr:hypothetical protein [Thiothrix sp.]